MNTRDIAGNAEEEVVLDHTRNHLRGLVLTRLPRERGNRGSLPIVSPVESHHCPAFSVGRDSNQCPAFPLGRDSNQCPAFPLGRDSNQCPAFPLGRDSNQCPAFPLGRDSNQCPAFPLGRDSNQCPAFPLGRLTPVSRLSSRSTYTSVPLFFWVDLHQCPAFPWVDSHQGAVFPVGRGCCFSRGSHQGAVFPVGRVTPGCCFSRGSSHTRVLFFPWVDSHQGAVFPVGRFTPVSSFFCGSRLTPMSRFSPWSTHTNVPFLPWVDSHQCRFSPGSQQCPAFPLGRLASLSRLSRGSTQPVSRFSPGSTHISVPLFLWVDSHQCPAFHAEIFPGRIIRVYLFSHVFFPV